MKKTKQIEKNAKIVNRYLNSKLKGNPKKLYDAAGHLIVNGGKRLRPYMVIKSCQILKGKVPNAMPAASAVEMVHNFSLVHDDIMDNDEMRHGVPTVHKKFGMPIAILAGDVLFSKAFQVITDSKLSANATTQLVSRLSKACVDICEGQLLDVKMAEEKKIVRLKQSGEAGLQRLEYTDFIGFSSSLSGIQLTAIAGNPFLLWHGKINSFEGIATSHDSSFL